MHFATTIRVSVLDEQRLDIMLQQTNKAARHVSVPRELQEGNKSPSLGGRINTYLSEDRSLIGTGLLMSFLVP